MMHALLLLEVREGSAFGAVAIVTLIILLWFRYHYIPIIQAAMRARIVTNILIFNNVMWFATIVEWTAFADDPISFRMLLARVVIINLLIVMFIYKFFALLHFMWREEREIGAEMHAHGEIHEHPHRWGNDT